MKKLKQQLEEISTYLNQVHDIKESVSKVAVGWHLEHSLKVINSILTQLKKSDPSNYQAKWFIWKFIIFKSGYIPRGKGRSPKQVLPEADTSKAQLEEMLNKARAGVEELSEIEDRSYFQHPYFGDLNKKETVRFLQIHTNHHLKIVRAIVK